MVSRCMVLFGITYLRLDIFITWWMNIFQSTIVLRHFVSQLIHHYMLGHTPFSESTRLFGRLSFTFWSSCWPMRVAYWGIPSLLGIIRPFIGFLIFWPSCRSLWVVILGHIPSCRVCLHRYPSYPLALGHLIGHYLVGLSLSFWGHTYIDRPSSYQFEFSFWDCTYIDRSSSCRIEFQFLGPHLYQSTIFLPVWVQFELGPYLYRSVIHFVSSVSGTAPISIGHRLFNLSLGF